MSEKRYWTPDRPMPDLTVGERRELIELVRGKVERNRLTYVWLIARLTEQGVRLDKYEMSAILGAVRLGAKANEVLRRSADILSDYERLMCVNTG